jgi:hypothetical protein
MGNHRAGFLIRGMLILAGFIGAPRLPAYGLAPLEGQRGETVGSVAPQNAASQGDEAEAPPPGPEQGREPAAAIQDLIIMHGPAVPEGTGAADPSGSYKKKAVR